MPSQSRIRSIGAPILEEFLQLDPENVPPAVGNLLAVFREPVDSYEQLGDEAISPQAVRAIVTEIVTRQRTEREVFVSALGAYKDLTDRLAVEVADARSELSAQAELAQLERAQLLKEFLDRLDVLTAKISTSAARYEAELAEKDVLLEDRERRAEIYAGHAINAQSMLDGHAPLDVMAGHCARPLALQDARPKGDPVSPRTSPDGALVTEFDPFSNNVSVIVLNYNQAATTVECLDALAAAHSELIREIIVVDNGSTHAELAILRERHRRKRLRPGRGRDQPLLRRGQQHRGRLRPRRLHRLPQQRRLRAAGLDRGPGSTMRSDPLVAAVGPMFLYPDGRVQEVGGIIVPTGDAVQIGKGAVWGPITTTRRAWSTTARPPAS